MIEKYKIHLKSTDNGGTLGIMFNDEKQLLTLGGNKRFRFQMISILEEFVGCKTIPEAYPIQKNKIRYECACTLKNFYRIIKELKEIGMYVETVKKLENIMR